MDENFIRDRITQLRIRKGVSEYQMSYDLGHSRGYIYNISSGKALPPMKEFLAICEYFELTPQQFFDENSEGLGQFDGAVLSIDGDSGHGDYLFLSDSLGSLFFISEGVVPFVVITLYDMEPMNLSLFLYWFVFLRKSKRKRADSFMTVAPQKDVSKLIQS